MTPLEYTPPLERFSKQEFDLKQSYKDLDNLTPVMFAARYGLNNKLCELLKPLDDSERDQILSAKNQGGLTPLHFAARYGQIETTRLLLKYGASPLIASNLAQLPIHSAFNENNSIDTIRTIVQCLMGDKDSISICNQEGDTVAHFAAAFDLTDILKQLHEMDVNLLNKTNNRQSPPLFIAILSNKLDAIEYLLTVTDLTLTDSRGRNALHYAAIYGTDEVLQKIIPYFSVNSIDGEHCTALYFIIKDQQISKMKTLLNAGAQLNIESSMQLPLHTAVLSLNRDLVDLILEYNGDINVTNSEGITPLFMLFLKGKNINSQPLINMVLYLLSKDADLDVPSHKEGTLRDYVRGINLPESIKHLNSNSPSNSR